MGISLLLRKADRDFYLSEGSISFGMYLGILREEISQGRGGTQLKLQLEAEQYDILFDDI
jgi:hypothetical protein